MSKEIVLKVSADGKDIKLLYFDDAPIRDLGSYSITRASHVRFDEKHQGWRVHVIQPSGKEVPIAGFFKNRAAAIDYEIEVLQKSLFNDPEFVDSMFLQAQAQA